jgi:predicted esterase
MRMVGLVLSLWVTTLAANVSAGESQGARNGGAPKPWCAPEVSELDDHVCYFDGGTPADGRRTLVVYLHGILATTPGFQWLQQRAMAIHAKRLNFTVLLPTSPRVDGGYGWPTSVAAQREHEAEIVTGIQKGRAELEERLGHRFDETYVVGFSSGAYYASSLAVRGALDVDGYIVLAGGASWVRNEIKAAKRAPVFVGISAADRQTAGQSRAFAGVLAGAGWPYRAEERNATHMVDWVFMTHGMQWLRGRLPLRSSAVAQEIIPDER